MNSRSRGGESFHWLRTHTPLPLSLRIDTVARDFWRSSKPKPPAKAVSRRAGLILAALVGLDAPTGVC